MSLTKAMLFSAGLGTRLRPLTNDRPKALVEINGKSILEWNIRNLEKQGIKTIIINIHHFSDLMKLEIAAIQETVNVELIISDESDAVLETGGGLLKAKEWIAPGESVLLHNVDILSTLSVEALYKEHTQHDSLATLAMQERTSSRYLLFDDKRLVGWKNDKTKEYKWSVEAIDNYTPFAFSGIQIIEGQLLNLIPFNGKFSIIDVYLHLASDYYIGAYKTDALWFDIGTIEKLQKATDHFDKLKYL